MTAGFLENKDINHLRHLGQPFVSMSLTMWNILIFHSHNEYHLVPNLVPFKMKNIFENILNRLTSSDMEEIFAIIDQIYDWKCLQRIGNLPSEWNMSHKKWCKNKEFMRNIRPKKAKKVLNIRTFNNSILNLEYLLYHIFSFLKRSRINWWETGVYSSSKKDLNLILECFFFPRVSTLILNVE